MVNSRHPVEKFKKKKQLLCFGHFYRRHTLLSSHAQKPPAFEFCMWTAYRARHVESAASVFMLSPCRPPTPTHLQADPSTVIKTLQQQRDKMFAAQVGPVALWSGFPPLRLISFHRPFSPTRSSTSSAVASAVGGE